MTATIHKLRTRIERRLASEEGFTLIELINVLLILAILMSISVSAYSTLKARAEEKSALSNVSVIIPAVNAWHSDNGTYAGMTMQLLNADYLSNAIDITYFDIGPTLDPTHFCVQYTAPSGSVIAKEDQSGQLTVGPANACT